MAKPKCDACEELREKAPSLIVNGLGDEECASLANDTGLNPSSGNNDCDDLHNMNDCLIGNMEAEIDAYDVCDWKDFMSKYIENSWTVGKGIICAICGLWAKFRNLCSELNTVAYIGVLTLYRTTQYINTSQRIQTPPFDANVKQGNVPDELLSVTSDYKGIEVNNITDVPLLVESSFNCSIRTEQHMASCYIVITRNGSKVGQAPFITPTTYDQQVFAESFVLNPGEQATMRYYFGIGDANDDNWFQNLFWKSGQTSEDARATLEPNNPSDPENQRSYFTVKVTSIMPSISC